jgi:outer membrane protein OmpA-like peptidoglycan-associated protein
MRKLFFALTTICSCPYILFSQTGDYRKPPALGIHFFFDDFKGASYVRSNGLHAALRDKQLSNFKDMAPGLALNYLYGLTNHLDLSVNMAGSFLAYPIPNRPAFTEDDFLLETDASINAKMFSDKHFFTPYLSVGIGVSKFTGYFGAFMPLGGGLQLNMFDDAYLLINSQWRVAVSENTAYHFYHSIGFAGTIGKRREKKMLTLPPPIPAMDGPRDRDGDGITDNLDSCPDIPGLIKFNGCPDSDLDGIPDKDDNCPHTPGVARYQGCPIPDTDRDGINDEEDKCPHTPGLARYQGCPIPDSDKDGVNDEEDKCPDIPGEVSNHGCPLIKPELEKKIAYAAQHIFFNTGRYMLLAQSFRPLDEVVVILRQNTALQLDIDGYTDNTGAADKNLLLSRQRADAVKNYLVSKGIDPARLNASGHGQESPIANNKTTTGRAANRRVELHVKY